MPSARIESPNHRRFAPDRACSCYAIQMEEATMIVARNRLAIGTQDLRKHCRRKTHLKTALFYSLEVHQEKTLHKTTQLPLEDVL